MKISACNATSSVPGVATENQRRRGIDLKNPFTMSNINPPVLDRGNFCLRPERRIISRDQKTGGAYRDRTDDLKLAKLALSQLS